MTTTTEALLLEQSAAFPPPPRVELRASAAAAAAATGRGESRLNWKELSWRREGKVREIERDDDDDDECSVGTSRDEKNHWPHPQPLLLSSAVAAPRIARHDQGPSYPRREHRAQRASEELAADGSVGRVGRGRRGRRRHFVSCFFYSLCRSTLSLSLSLSPCVFLVHRSRREQVRLARRHTEKERETGRESRGRKRQRPGSNLPLLWKARSERVSRRRCRRDSALHF